MEYHLHKINWGPLSDNSLLVYIFQLEFFRVMHGWHGYRSHTDTDIRSWQTFTNHAPVICVQLDGFGLIVISLFMYDLLNHSFS